jgi:hypothetical protein
MAGCVIGTQSRKLQGAALRTLLMWFAGDTQADRQPEALPRAGWACVRPRHTGAHTHLNVLCISLPVCLGQIDTVYGSVLSPGTQVRMQMEYYASEQSCAPAVLLCACAWCVASITHGTLYRPLYCPDKSFSASLLTNCVSAVLVCHQAPKPRRERLGLRLDSDSNTLPQLPPRLRLRLPLDNFPDDIAGLN